MNLYREAFRNIKKFSREFWIVVFAAFINQMGNMAFVFLVVYATQYLGLTVMQGTAAVMTVSTGMLISNLAAGYWIDRVGAGRVMIAAAFVNSLVLLGISQIHDFYLLLFVSVIWGFSFGIYRPAAQTLLSFLSVEGMHKITFSINRLAINLGMSIGPAMGGFIAAYSYPALFIVNSISNLLAGLILLIGLSGSAWLVHRPSSDLKKIPAVKWLKQDAALRFFLLSLVPVLMVFFQHESTLPVFLKQTLHIPLSFYGLMFTVNTLLIVFFELALNIATLHWKYRTSFMLGAFFNAVGFGGFYFVTTEWEIILLVVIWTMGEMILFPAASSYIAHIAPAERRGSYMSLYNLSSNLGLFLGPWAGAVVMQHLGVHMLWLACGAWALVSVVCFRFVRQPTP